MLAPAGPNTVLATAGRPMVLPAMDDAGSRPYAVDLAQIAAPGDRLIQVDAVAMPSGLLGGLSVRWDQATVLLTARSALATGTVVILLAAAFRSGTASVLSVSLPVIAATNLPTPDDGVLKLNGYALTIGGVPIALVGGPQPVTFDQTPLTIGGTPILLGA